MLYNDLLLCKKKRKGQKHISKTQMHHSAGSELLKYVLTLLPDLYIYIFHEELLL